MKKIFKKLKVRTIRRRAGRAKYIVLEDLPEYSSNYANVVSLGRIHELLGSKISQAAFGQNAIQSRELRGVNCR